MPCMLTIFTIPNAIGKDVASPAHTSPLKHSVPH